MLVGEFCQREYSLKTVAAATSLGIQCTPNWRMRKLDLATIGLYEKSFIFGGGVALALVSSSCLRVAKARLCPAQGRGVRAGAMGTHGPPFTRRRALPLVKRAKKRVRIFVAEKISGFIQLQRGMQQIMLREFASRLFDQLLELTGAWRELTCSVKSWSLGSSKIAR